MGPAVDIYFPSSLSKPVHVQKMVDPSTGQTSIVTDNSLVTKMSDLDHFRSVEDSVRRAKWGAMSSDLGSLLDGSNDNALVNVIVTMKTPVHTPLDKMHNSIATLKANALSMMQSAPIKTSSTLLSQHQITPNVLFNQDDHHVEAQMEKSDLRKLAFDTGVAQISLKREPTPCAITASTRYATPFSCLANSAFNPAPMPSYGQGAGVRSATFEPGIWQYVVDYHHLNPSQISWILPNSMDASLALSNLHANLTLTCLINAAPQANIFHVPYNDYGTSITDGQFQFITGQAIQTISVSTANFGTGFGDPHTNLELLCMDEMAFIYPYPVIVTPSNNNGFQYPVDWPCYNAISVGCDVDTPLTWYKFGGGWGDCSQAANPMPVYGGFVKTLNNLSGDREMPYVVSPGYSPVGCPGCKWNMTDTACDSVLNLDGVLPPQIQYTCGSSYSAPTVNGIAADVIGASNSFVDWPEAVRTAIILTAENVSGSYWVSSIDGKDGAGTVSGYNAVQYARNCTNVGPQNSACQTGISIGEITSMQSTLPILYNIAIPATKPSGKHLRVVLTWDATPDLVNNLNYLCNLDLWVTNPNNNTAGPYGYSASYDGNVEVCDIPAANISTSSLVAHILIAALRFPASQNYTYYSIGWTWVSDAPVPPGGVSKARSVMSSFSSCHDSLSSKLSGGPANFCDTMETVSPNQRIPFTLSFKMQPGQTYSKAHPSKNTFNRVVSTYVLYDTAACVDGSCSMINQVWGTPSFYLDSNCGSHRIDSTAYDSTVQGYSVSATSSTINALVADSAVSFLYMLWPTCPVSTINSIKKQTIISIPALMKALRTGTLKNAKVTIYAINGKILPLSIFSSSSRHNETIIVRIIQNNQEYSFKDVLTK
jgi:hypothetical protein